MADDIFVALLTSRFRMEEIHVNADYDSTHPHQGKERRKKERKKKKEKTAPILQVYDLYAIIPAIIKTKPPETPPHFHGYPTYVQCHNDALGTNIHRSTCTTSTNQSWATSRAACLLLLRVRFERAPTVFTPHSHTPRVVWQRVHWGCVWCGV